MFLVLNSLSVHKINVKHYLSLYLINKKEHNLSKLIGLLNLRLVLSLHVQIFKVKFFYHASINPTPITATGDRDRIVLGSLICKKDLIPVRSVVTKLPQLIL